MKLNAFNESFNRKYLIEEDAEGMTDIFAVLGPELYKYYEDKYLKDDLLDAEWDEAIKKAAEAPKVEPHEIGASDFEYFPDEDMIYFDVDYDGVVYDLFDKWLQMIKDDEKFRGINLSGNLDELRYDYEENCVPMTEDEFIGRIIDYSYEIEDELSSKRDEYDIDYDIDW